MPSEDPIAAAITEIVEAGSLLGFRVVAATPEGYDPDPTVMREALEEFLEL